MSTRKSSRARLSSGTSPAKKRRAASPSLSTFSLVAAIDPALGPDIEKDVLEETVIIMAQECQLVGSNFDAMDEDTSVERVSSAIFKDPNFIHSSKGAAGTKRTRVWKNLKQIVTTERSLPWQPSDVTYGSIEAPPSFKPPKKYSDLSGLTAKYTDPQTKIRYADPDEFTRVRMLPSDLVTGFLALRKASAPVP